MSFAESGASRSWDSEQERLLGSAVWPQASTKSAEGSSLKRLGEDVSRPADMGFGIGGIGKPNRAREVPADHQAPSMSPQQTPPGFVAPAVHDRTSRRLDFSIPPARPRIEPTVLERLATDIAKDGLQAAMWHGLEIVGEACAPGMGGTFVKATHTATRIVGAIKSYSEGDGVDIVIPVAAEPSTGLSFAARGRFLDENPQSSPSLQLDVGWDPFDRPSVGVPRVEAATERGIVIMACRAEIRDATGYETVGANALMRYASLAGLRPTAPHLITYLDYDTNLGLVTVVPENGKPYCPTMFRFDRRDRARGFFQLWNAPHSRTLPEVKSHTGERTVEWQGDGWPVMLDELNDRFADPVGLLVATAVASSVTAQVIGQATTALGDEPDRSLEGLGAYGPSYLARIVRRRAADISNLRVMRHACQDVVRWSIVSGSVEAVECRRHIADLLANTTLLCRLMDATDVEPSGRLLELLVEALEGLAALSETLGVALTNVYKDRAVKG